MVWDWEFAIFVFPELLKAIKWTVAATFVGFSIALFLGLALALARRSHWKPVSWLAAGFVEFVRSTPLLVQLLFLFYILPRYGITLSPFTTGVIGLGLHYSTYCSEVFRSGIEAVPRGQWEASTALNFSRVKSWTRIILPQAIPPIIPVLGNYLIVMFKETPLLSAIMVAELLLTAKNIGAEWWRYLEPITIVGLLFLLISYPASLLVRMLEVRMNTQRGR
jgi:polar amino acid transport system permease protein